MHNINATLSVLKQETRHLGIDLPKKLVTALNKADKSATAAVPDLDRHALALAIQQASADGREVASDPAVQEQITRWALRQLGITGALREAAESSRADALRTHLPDLIGTWEPLAAAAGDAILAMSQRYPNLDLTDLDSASRVNAADATAWRHAAEAVVTLKRITKLWRLTTGVTLGPRSEPLILAPLTGEQLNTLTAAEAKPPAWKVATFTAVEIAEPEDYHARYANVRADFARIASAPASATTARRREYGRQLAAPYMR